MSTIGVKYHNEDIHNIIHKPLPPTIKSPRYKSKRKSLIHKDMLEKKKYNGHQTFGLARYDPPDSWNYLKKNKPKNLPSTVKLIDKNEFKCTNCNKKDPIPKGITQLTKHSSKDFVKENIKKAAAIEPKLPIPRKVETPRGTVKDMAHLLQMIKIRQSEEYGRIPKYLCERRKQWEVEKEKKRAEELAIKEYKQKMGIGTMGMSENVYMVDKETRQKLLDGLKENWNELSKQFLKLPVMTDTWTKLRRKMWLEKEIDQLEKDVKLVESHPYIYLERQDKRSYGQIVTEEIAQRERKSTKIESDKQNEKQEPEPEVPQEESKVGEEEKEKEKVETQPTEQSPIEEAKCEDEEPKIVNY